MVLLVGHREPKGAETEMPHLSSPRQSSTLPGKAVQRAVCGAGWNHKGPRNTSVLRYRVVSRDGKPGKTLNGVVVQQPQRFFAPVPPANPHLQPAPAESGKSRGSIPSRTCFAPPWNATRQSSHSRRRVG